MLSPRPMQNALVFSAPRRGPGESAGPQLADDHFRAGSGFAEAFEDALLGLDLQGVIRSWICMGRSADPVEVALSGRGPGFDTNAIGESGWGIAGMKERLRPGGGAQEILAGATGTEVTARVPVTP
jgi:hypothetical protein